jgi:hypothetical protein
LGKIYSSLFLKPHELSRGFFISSGNAKYYLARNNFTPHIHHGFAHSFSFEPCLPNHTEYQLRVEPFPGPRGHPLVIEVCGDLAAIQTVIPKPQDAVDECLMGKVSVYPRQRLGLYGNPKTEVAIRRPLKPFKGKSEITPP